MAFCEKDDCFNQACWIYYVSNYETLCDEHKNSHFGETEKFLDIEKLNKDTLIKFIKTRYKIIKRNVMNISNISLDQNPNEILKKGIINWRNTIIGAAKSLETSCKDANEQELKIILIKINYFKRDYTEVKEINRIEQCNLFYYTQKFELSEQTSSCSYKIEKLVSSAIGRKIYIREFIIIHQVGEKFLMKSCLYDKNESIEFLHNEIEFLKNNLNNNLFLKYNTSETIGDGDIIQTIYYTELRGISLDEKLKVFSFNEVKVIEFFKFIKKALSQLENTLKIEYIDPSMIYIDKDFIFARLKCDNLERNPEFVAPDYIESELKPYFCASLIAFRILGITLTKWKSLNLKKANRIKAEKYPNLKTFLLNILLAPTQFSLSDFNNLIA